jgi:hypothetical protein
MKCCWEFYSEVCEGGTKVGMTESWWINDVICLQRLHHLTNYECLVSGPCLLIVDGCRAK